MRAPAAAGWVALGTVLALVGAIPVGDQINAIITDPLTGFVSAWCIGGLVALSVGVSMVILGVFMRDKDETPKVKQSPVNPDEVQNINATQRVGIRMRGNSKFNGMDAHISNQDLSLDMDDHSQWDGNKPVID